MQVENAVMPSPEQLQSVFGDPAVEGPMVMVNLLRFKPLAQYPDGRDKDLSGKDAYMRYGAAVQSCLQQVGGRMLYSGPVTGLLIGTVAEPWDMVVLAWYPSAKAMMDMVALPDYRGVEVHRLAGLEGQLNIRTAPQVTA